MHFFEVRLPAATPVPEVAGRVRRMTPLSARPDVSARSNVRAWPPPREHGASPLRGREERARSVLELWPETRRRPRYETDVESLHGRVVGLDVRHDGFGTDYEQRCSPDELSHRLGEEGGGHPRSSR